MSPTSSCHVSNSYGRLWENHNYFWIRLLIRTGTIGFTFSLWSDDVLHKSPTTTALRSPLSYPNWNIRETHWAPTQRTWPNLNSKWNPSQQDLPKQLRFPPLSLWFLLKNTEKMNNSETKELCMYDICTYINRWICMYINASPRERMSERYLSLFNQVQSTTWPFIQSTQVPHYWSRYR